MLMLSVILWLMLSTRDAVVVLQLPNRRRLHEGRFESGFDNPGKA